MQRVLTVASAIARALGAGDLQRAETLIWHALALAAMGAVALLVVFLLAGSEFLRFLGGSGSVLEQALSYSYVLFFGGIFLGIALFFIKRSERKKENRSNRQ